MNSHMPVCRGDPEAGVVQAGGTVGNEEMAGRENGGSGMYRLAEDVDGNGRDEGCQWVPPALRTSLERYRWLEIILLSVIVILAKEGFGSGVKKHRQYIPLVTQVLPGGAVVVLGNATAFSYPVRFREGALECPPVTLEFCATSPESALADPCCEFMTTGAKPFQTVSHDDLIWITVGLPLILLVLRHLLLKWYLCSVPASSADPMFSSEDKRALRPLSGLPFGYSATFCLRDVLIGLFFSLALTRATTNSLKMLTSQPRPNNFALRLFASLSPDSSAANHYAESAWKAWPSGHSSMSMASGAFLSLVLLRDLRQFAGALQRQLRACLVILALGPVYLAMFVAGTRVHDYFHTTADAVTGSVLGLLWAVLAFYQVVPAGGLEVRANPPLKYL